MFRSDSLEGIQLVVTGTVPSVMTALHTRLGAEEFSIEGTLLRLIVTHV
jgi:hypothetical protein